jgi:hypothetical protein
MAAISGPSTSGAIDLYTSTATPGVGMSVGQIVEGRNGKKFAYVLNGAANLVVGNLLQSSAEDTTYENMAVGTAAASGDKVLQVTNGTATITDEQFRGGSLTIYTAGTIGIGDEYTIMGVTGTLTTGGALYVLLDRPLRAAVTTSAKVNMKRSPYSGVIQFPATTQTGIPVGFAIYPITANQYGWIQTWGEVGALSDGSTFAVGSEVGTPSGTAGAVTVYAAGTTHSKVGMVQQAAASGHGISVYAQIR